jgi:hypothetical protein
MQTQRTVDRAPTPPSPDATHVTRPAVSPRSARRATARRASNRRATARLRKADIDGRIIDFMKDHPQSTTGAIAKGLNTDRGVIAARRSRIALAEGTGDGQGAEWPWARAEPPRHAEE